MLLFFVSKRTFLIKIRIEVAHLLKIALIYFCNYIGQNAQIGVVNQMVLVLVVSEFAVIVSNHTVIIMIVVTAHSTVSGI